MGEISDPVDRVVVFLVYIVHDIVCSEDWEEGSEEEPIVDDEEEPQGDASRVTVLLHRYGPYCFTDANGKTRFKPTWLDNDAVSINARRSISAQLAKFPALGWGQSPPTWRELVHCMTSRSMRSIRV